MQRPCGKDYSDITTDSGEVSQFYVNKSKILIHLRYVGLMLTISINNAYHYIILTGIKWKQ